MFSIQLLEAMVDERERMVKDHVRVRSLLRVEPTAGQEPRQAAARQPEPWRASTPRARATTR